jgi:hypothetical protein
MKLAAAVILSTVMLVPPAAAHADSMTLICTPVTIQTAGTSWVASSGTTFQCVTQTANIQSPPPPPEVRAMEVCDAHSITSPPQDALSIDTSPLRYPDPKAKWPHAWRDCLILEKKVYEKEERIIKKEQEDAARAQKVEDDHAKWLVTHTASHFK